MRDSYGREISYMRISVTDACNLRCRYCLPEEVCVATAAVCLTGDEIIRIAAAGVSLGIRHYKITGGEPLLRPDCAEIIRRLKQTEGVETVTLTTNGVLLAQSAEMLRAAGIDRVNVSLDSAEEKQYRTITGKDSFLQVCEGIRAAKEAGIVVRLNCVSDRDTDYEGLVLLAESFSVPVRLIEMMPIGYARGRVCISGREVLERLAARFGTPVSCQEAGNGPAFYVRFPQLAVPVGFISAVHGPFCGSCNRIRVTCEGRVKPCLCYEDSYDIRPFLQKEGQREACAEYLKEIILKKPEAHCFDRVQQVTEHKAMSRIGG